jgi:predicted anti-sigma-YlaC factor YlaD
MDANHLTCEQAEALISDSLDGGLAPEQQEALDDHLHACPTCVVDMQNAVTLRMTLAGLGRAEVATVRPLMSDTIQRLAAETRRRVLEAAEEQRRAAR